MHRKAQEVRSNSIDMQERYVIRGKVGQGGLGVVYRAWDQNLRREVAIKRILTGDNDGQRKEATRQMEHEVGALAALQHPHIVTIHDVGDDDDGPFVVMELLKGQTLDELVEKAPLTWKDFRELVQQIMEGLIAAQDLGFVHRDLKPSNVMINWLPSGKFQAKIVDFGLAKFSPKPSNQTVDQNDSVYGSIFFMAPEQFERGLLDARTDMYAIGCVYYFALTGVTPFQGDTAPQVMASHLEHRVESVADLRPDIPQWMCDWVMWHMNRQPGDRPKNAREAMQSFMELDVTGQIPYVQQPAPSPSAPDQAPTAEVPHKPRLIIPNTQPQQASAPPNTQTAAAPMQPPGASQVPQTGTQNVVQNPAAQASAPIPQATPNPATHSSSQVAAVPNPAAPTTASTPVAYPNAGTGTAPTADPSAPVPPQQAPTSEQPVQDTSQQGNTGVVGKFKSLSSGARIAIMITLAVVVIIMASLLIGKVIGNNDTKRYNEIIELVANPSTTEIMMSEDDLDVMLGSTNSNDNRQRNLVYKALRLAVASDATDVDKYISEYTTTETMKEDVRKGIMDNVLAPRQGQSALPALIQYAKEAPSEDSAAAALRAIKDIGGKDMVYDLLSVLEFTSSSTVRGAAEAAIANALEETSNPTLYDSDLSNAAKNAANDDNRRSLIRLLGHVGGSKANQTLEEALKSGDKYDMLAAIHALSKWPDNSVIEKMGKHLDETLDDDVRRETFSAAYTMVTDVERKLEERDRETLWKLLARNARTEQEQLKVVNGISRRESASWAPVICGQIKENAISSRVSDEADRATDRIRQKMREGN